MLSLSTSLATGMPKGCTNKKTIYYQYVMSIYGAKNGRHHLAIPEKNHADYLILYAKTSREHSKNGLSDFQKLLMLHDETM
ncbi:MAG: hypothetical protein P8Y08_13555 [Desulfobulbaceae bacterium]